MKKVDRIKQELEDGKTNDGTNEQTREKNVLTRRRQGVQCCGLC